jgi:glycosyltransferase involved in cell wall biosynthesis
MTPYIIHDLVMATRLARPTGVERVALNTFAASAARNPNVIALVSDARRAPAGYPIIEVGHYVPGWATAYWRIPKSMRNQAVMICGCAPISPSMRLNKMPVARIIADDFPWKRGDQMPLKGRLLFRDYESAMLDRYDFIFTISDIAQEQLENTLNRKVGLAGCATGIVPTADAIRPENIGEKPILLLVGTIEPRKNYGALERIVTPHMLDRWQIVVVGRPGWKDAEKQLQAIPGVTWLKEASDANLRWLYQHAHTFMSLSHAEGFNMPLVEAGSYGLNIICSNLPVHRSVAPSWAAFVETDVDGSAIIKNLEKMSNNRPRIEDVNAYARLYSWSTVCDNIETPLIAKWRVMNT